MVLLETAVRFDLFVRRLDGIKTLAGLLLMGLTQVQYFVRMKLHGELPVGFLHFGIGRGRSDFQDLIGVR